MVFETKSREISLAVDEFVAGMANGVTPCRRGGTRYVIKVQRKRERARAPRDGQCVQVQEGKNELRRS